MKRWVPTPCKLCGATPIIGRTVKSYPGDRGKGWVIFCDSEDHYLETVGRTRSPAKILWNKLMGAL